MKVTSIKSQDGKKVTKEVLENLAKAFRREVAAEGFITEVNVVNSSRIDLGMHMKSFIIDPKVHGHNTRYNPYSNPKRTSTPSWDQRVKYNNIINTCLNMFGLSATIVSGCFKVRQGFENFTESDWHSQIPSWVHHNENNGHYVEQGFDENEFKARRLKAAQERRAKAKQSLFQKPHLSIVS